MKKVLAKIFGDVQSKTIKRLRKKVEKINHLSKKYAKFSDKKLKDEISSIRKEIDSNKNPLDHYIADVFAIVREAAERSIGLRPFDVQLIGGMVLHEGNVSEMRTGEGKTLVATLPVTLNALEGKGVHVVTVNDYLAQRDAGWMGSIYSLLGLSVGVIIPDASFIYDPEYRNEEHDDERFLHLKPCSRQEAYQADITYGTNNEFGFDYLRDNMVRDVPQLRQRSLNYAIVDEVDSILIDEARTPLIISAPAMDSGNKYAQFSQIARRLNEDDYELDEKRRAVSINDEGIAKVQKLLNVENLYSPENVQLIYHLDQALRAQTLFKKDRDYIVSEDDEVIIVDEFTGRLMHGRRYNEGLHQAIEAKEGVAVLQESMTLATISFQNYFRLYKKLAGMTGTAKTEEEEFHQIYKLDVIEIPTNKNSIRVDRPDRIYKNEKGKFTALVKDVKELHERGQPVLIGTVSIEKNEKLSYLLKKAGIPHQVLNAKNNVSEALIIARAGQKGAVTLATNIAGRGTDIVLGEGVTKLGGLMVLGSERHESRRIDNQLRGRCGRQGDPGITQFYVSTEDELMRIFGGERVATLMDKLGVDEETPIENRAVSKALENAQKKVESFNFDSRKHVVQFDDVMNRHRKSVYKLRKSVLENKYIETNIQEMIDEEVNTLGTDTTQEKNDFLAQVKSIFPLEDKYASKLKKAESAKRASELKKIVADLYKDRKESFSPEIFSAIEREIYLQVLDTYWMQHLENMDHLREGINLRSIGQKDPLVEYRREGQRLFEIMQASMSNEVVKLIFHAVPRVEELVEGPVETELTKAARHSQELGASEKTGRGIQDLAKKNESSREPDSVDQKKKPSNKKQDLRKKRKKQRQNRKKRK